MEQIRKRVFETNSSSMHTVTFTHPRSESNNLLEIDKDTNKVIGRFDEFGWGYEEYTDAEHKLRYLLTMIVENSRTIEDLYESEDFKNIENAIMKHVNCDGIIIDEDCYGFEIWSDGSQHLTASGYIDHQSIYPNIQYFLDDNHVDSIEDFIFNSGIRLVISNDNCY